MQKLFQFFKSAFKKDIVLSLAVILAAVSSFFYTPSLKYIDFDVLLILFSLMIVVAFLKNIKFLDWLAIKLLDKCQTFRGVVTMLVTMAFFISMFVTNDVALITFVPLALVIGKTIKKDMILPVIFMTLAANLGSMFTPQGNPQNLFLFNFFQYTAFTFLNVMLLPTILSGLYISFLLKNIAQDKVEFQMQNVPHPNKFLTILAISLLILNILSVLHYFDKTFALGITLFVVILANWHILFKIDYGLLLTFVGFFIFIGNIQQTELVIYLKNSLLGTQLGTYLVAIGSSQFISNVPAAMLLASLTNQANALLVGVNVGGLGTLIASMASVISYKLFVFEHPYLMVIYLRSFFFYNFLGLFLIGLLSYLFFIFQ